MERNPALPPLPRFKFEETLLSIQTLNRVFGDYRDKQMTPELALRMAIDASKALDCPEAHLHQTMLQYCGLTLDQRFLAILAAQLAGRERELLKGAIVAYDRPLKQEWVAMEVLRVEPVAWRETQPGTLIHFQCLSGHPSGHILKRKFPDTWLSYFAYKVGFSRRIPYDDDPRYFIGLRLWGFLQPVEGSTEIRFDDWDLSSAFKKHNLRVIRLRTRLDYDLAECPEEYEHHCFDCHIGKDQCPASCLQTSIRPQPNSTQQTKPG